MLARLVRRRRGVLAERDLVRARLRVVMPARAERGRSGLVVPAKPRRKIAPVRIAEALDEAIDLARPLGAQRHIAIEKDLGNCAGQYVLADRQRLLQVLLNLLSNATKYNRYGGSVNLSCELRSPDMVRIGISDTGPGIARHAQARLFTPFERLTAAESGIEGAGLGLAVSKTLVEAMGGSIGVETVAGRGSTFWIDLRATPTPEEELEFEATTRQHTETLQ